METLTLYGTLQFSPALICAKDSLGKTIEIAIAGHGGALSLPSLPRLLNRSENGLPEPLNAPARAKTLLRGKKNVRWGNICSYPTHNAEARFAFLEFQLPVQDFDKRVQHILDAVPIWLELFKEYVTLLTKQDTRPRVAIESADSVDLYVAAPEGERRASTKRIDISLYYSKEDVALHLAQLKAACSAASAVQPPRLEYRVMLGAYYARKNRDYRKAIIEAATALEVCLTSRARTELQERGITFWEDLLKKFRMLSGRFALLRMLDISLPERDEYYKKHVIEPRNETIHLGKVPAPRVAEQVIHEVETLLRMLSPDIPENPCYPKRPKKVCAKPK